MNKKYNKPLIYLKNSFSSEEAFAAETLSMVWEWGDKLEPDDS